VKEFVEGIVSEVARDPSLNMPKKLECFPDLAPAMKDMVLGYNALRNALEHHHDLPKRELTVTVRRMIPVVGEQEITEFPMLVQEGGTLSMRIINVERVFPANQKVVLEPQAGYDLLFTLRHIIGTAFFQSHIRS